jgi:hypothetical protein
MPAQTTIQVLRLAKPLSGAQVQQALSNALGSSYSGTGFKPSSPQSSGDQQSQRSQRSRSRWRQQQQQHNHD